MSDHIHIEKGRPPHLPSESSELRAVYHQFTIPLVGLIVQHDVPYLFWCVVGAAAPESAWAYARLDTEADANVLADATNEAFDAALSVLVSGRVCTFAVASDESGVTEWVTIEPPADFDTAYSRGMELLSAKVNEVMAEMKQLMEQFPSIRQASTFSISPSPARV